MHSQPLLMHMGAVALALGATASAKVLPRQSNPGVDLANMGSSEQTFYFCENASNGDGTADPGFTHGTSGCSNFVTSVVVQPSSVSRRPIYLSPPPMSLNTHTPTPQGVTPGALSRKQTKPPIM